MKSVSQRRSTHETLTRSREKFEAVDVSGADFDGVTFRLSTEPDNKAVLRVSMFLHYGNELKKYGSDAVVKKAYGDWVQTPQENYTVTLKVDLDAASQDEKKKSDYIARVPLIKRYVMMSPFEFAFDKYSKGESFDPVVIPYRPAENIYILTFEKSLTVVFSIRFSDPDDVVLARMFLNEFKDARKDRALGSAPGVNFTQGKRPTELNNVKGNEPDDKQSLQEYGFVSFGLFPSHMKEEKREDTIDKLLTFRNYFHYHLKCTKAYMHFRMRDRFSKLLDTLDGAKDTSGIIKEKKTASGRRFIEK